MKTKRKLDAPSKGQSLVEFALVMPFLIFLIMGIFDLGWAVYANNSVALAAREGARTGIVASKSDTQICSQATGVAQGLSVTCTISPSGSRTAGGTVSVTVRYTWTPITPMIGNILGSGGNMSLQSQATMQVE